MDTPEEDTPMINATDTGATPTALSLSTGSAPMHPAHWLWISPIAITLSPIGTILLTASLGLDFLGCLKLISAQVAGFALLYALSNGGE